MGRAEDLFQRIEVGGESIIDEYINTRRSEELFIDFKRSSDNGSNTCLSDNDRNNLAKAISGFGNSEGGILIWGIDCSKDKDGTDIARYKNPIINPSRFVSWLENAVSGCTVPPHPGVRNISICLDGGDKGFVITYIPKSHHAPHQVVGKLQYYIRAGSNFVPVPHMVLSGMFGRPYPSHVFAMYLVAPATVEGRFISSELGIMIRNDGPGIVQDLYTSIMIHSFPYENSTIEFDRCNPETWGGYWSFGMHISLITNPGFRLPPEAQVQPVTLKIKISPPFNKPINIKGIAGAGSNEPYRFTFSNSIENINNLYNEFMKGHISRVSTKDVYHKFTGKLLGLKDEDVENDA